MGEEKLSWADEMNNLLAKQLEGVRVQEIRFLRMEEFSRVIQFIDKNSNECSICQGFKIEIESIIPEINSILLHPGKQRKRYDELINRITKHFRKSHGIFPEFYFTYLLSAAGMGIGFVVGMIAETIRWMFLGKLSWELWFGAIVIGLIWGHLKGVKKDAHIKRNGKLL